jgi:putative transposase
LKKGQFSQEQIIAILHQAEKGEQTIQALCREHGLTETTFYRWRKVYGGMTVSEAYRLRGCTKIR